MSPKPPLALSVRPCLGYVNEEAIQENGVIRFLGIKHNGLFWKENDISHLYNAFTLSNNNTQNSVLSAKWCKVLSKCSTHESSE